MRKVLMITIALGLLIGLSGLAFARPVVKLTEQTIVSDDTPYTTLREPAANLNGPDFFAAAGPQTVWYGGTSVTTGGPLAAVGGKWTWSASGYGAVPHSGYNLDGWTSRDALESADVYFRRHDMSNTPCTPLAGSWSFWCGVDANEAAALCYAGGAGYGNSWGQILHKSITLSGDATTTLTYLYAFDSEQDFDYTYVEIDSAGTWVPLPVNAGAGNYTGTGSGSESVNIGPYLTGAGTYDLRFRFTSDGGYSDEDGLNATPCGGFICDNIQITETTLGLVEDTNCEAGMNGWAWIGTAGPGNWVHTEYNPTIDDPCIPNDPTWCSIGDSVIAMYDVTASPTAPHRDNQETWIISPAIPIAGTAGAGLPAHMIQFETFRDLPLLDHVFYAWYVQYYPYTCGFGNRWSPYYGNNTVYYSASKSCATFLGDLSAYVPACADSVKMAIACINLCAQDPWNYGCTMINNKTPYFDNARFGAAGSANTPTVVDMEWDKYLDMFPTDGTLNCGSTANIGISVSGDATYYAMGDSLDVDGSTCPGFTGMEVWMHWKVSAGPCLNTSGTWFSVFPTGVWNAARMDTAQRGSSLAPSTWMGCYHEADVNYGLASGRWAGEGNEIIPDGLMTPGTKIDYYISTNYVGNANSFVLQNQEPGFTSLPDDITILPSIVGSPHAWKGEYPCLLYVDDCDTRGAQRWVEDALTCVPANWDRYDKRAPTSTMKNGIGRATGFEKGATVVQLQAYSSVLLDALNVYSGSIENEDTNLFTGWLSGATADNPRFLMLSGDEISRYLNAGTSRKAFMNTYMGTTYSARYYYTTSGNTAWCVDLADLAGNRIDGGAMLTEGSLRGNMCPNVYNIIGVQAGTNGVGEMEFSDANPTVHRATVSNQVVDGSSNVLYRTVFSSYSTARVRTLTCPGGVYSWSFGDSTGVCGTPTLKGWQDDVRDKVLWGGLLGTCNRVFIGVPGGVNVSTAVDELKGAYPNPMNPATTISFAVKNDGKVSLRVYDASGRLIKTLVNGSLKAGSHSVPWDGTNDRGVKVGSGVFFYQMETEGGLRTAKKIVILK